MSDHEFLQVANWEYHPWVSDPAPRGRNDSEFECEYIFLKGRREGVVCGAERTAGEIYCRKHIKSEIVRTGYIEYRETGVLECACRNGQRDEVTRIMCDYGKANRMHKLNFNQGLYGACEGGQKKMAELMIIYGANDWNLGLAGACKGGKRKMVDFMLLQAKQDDTEIDWNWGLYHACIGGQKEMAKLMIAHPDRASGVKCDWNLGLIGACHFKQKELILLMLINGATKWNKLDLTEKDIDYLVLNGRHIGIYDNVEWKRVNYLSVTLYKMLSTHLVDDLITVFFQYIF